MSRTAAVPTRCFGHVTGSLPSADALNYLPMFTLAFEHTHRVLLTRFTGWLSSEDIVQLDRAVVAFVVRAGPVRGLLDFSGIEGITAPPPFFAVRGQSPQIAPRKRRVIVAPHRELYDLARAFAAQQREWGQCRATSRDLASGCLSAASPEETEVSTGSRPVTAYVAVPSAHGGPSAHRGSAGAADHGRRHRPPGQRPDRHPLPPRADRDPWKVENSPATARLEHP